MLLPGDLRGEVTHYFPKVRAAVVRVRKGAICIGDVLYFKGTQTDFKQSTFSMQINRKPIEKAGPGKEIGVEVSSEVRPGDLVYQIKA